MWDRSTELFVSAAAFWKIDLKSNSFNAKGDSKLPLKRPPGEMLAYLSAKGVQALPIDVRHTIGRLTVAPNHQGRFDRMMLKQAQAERMKTLTNDSQLIPLPLVVAAIQSAARQCEICCCADTGRGN